MLAEHANPLAVCDGFDAITYAPLAASAPRQVEDALVVTTKWSSKRK